MRIIESSFEIVDPTNQAEGIKLLQKIERMARISHRSEDKITPDSWDRFVRTVVIDRGDWSVVEHASATIILRVDRGITHELVRHRLFSFTQESTRFVRNDKEIEFIIPTTLIDAEEFTKITWGDTISIIERNYHALLSQGIRPQEARSVLPNSLAATIAITGNLRNFRHLFLMRTSRESHPDMRRIIIPLLEEFQKLIPILYEDILPGKRQIDNLRMPR